MTRSLRRWHGGLWLILGPLILLGLILALSARPATPIQVAYQSSADHTDRAASVEGTP